jgi:hypothetical protein
MKKEKEKEKKKNKKINGILLTTLAARLERAIHADVGMRGLKILIYGWKRKHHLIDDFTFYNRSKEDGEAYLTLGETMSLSNYAGYDLTHD